MLSDPQREYIRTVTLTLQIIVGALASGVLLFLAVVVYMVSQNPPAAAGDSYIITYAAFAFAVVAGIASLIVPSLVSVRARNSLVDGDISNWGLVKNLPNVAELGEVAPLAAIYQTRTIIGAALCEGAAFFACVTYQIEHQRSVLFVAVVLLLMIARHIPTVSGLESWIESELATIRQMRQLK
jgi:hypothetical protein